LPDQEAKPSVNVSARRRSTSSSMVTACSLPLPARVAVEDVAVAVAKAVVKAVASTVVVVRDEVTSVVASVAAEAKAVVTAVDADVAREAVVAEKVAAVVAVEVNLAPISPTPARSPAWVHSLAQQLPRRYAWLSCSRVDDDSHRCPRE